MPMHADPRVSSVDAAEAKDAAPPLAKLEALLAESKGQAKVGKSDAKSVVFLLNMEDLRSASSLCSIFSR